jgi:hypothetical protein
LLLAHAALALALALQLPLLKLGAPRVAALIALGRCSAWTSHALLSQERAQQQALAGVSLLGAVLALRVAPHLLRSRSVYA